MIPLEIADMQTLQTENMNIELIRSNHIESRAFSSASYF